MTLFRPNMSNFARPKACEYMRLGNRGKPHRSRLAPSSQTTRRNLPIGRVVYRGQNNANANGGVSNANANNDASNSNANVGSRLEIKQSAYSAGDVSPRRCRGRRAAATAAYRWKAERPSAGVEFGRLPTGISKKSGPVKEGRFLPITIKQKKQCAGKGTS